MKNSELNCEQALGQLFAYLDRELQQHDHAAMEEHLKVCKACFSRLEFERLLKSKVKELREERASPRVKGRVRALLKDF